MKRTLLLLSVVSDFRRFKLLSYQLKRTKRQHSEEYTTLPLKKIPANVVNLHDQQS